MVNEDELISRDAGEAFAGKMSGALAGPRAEKIEENPVLGAESEGDAFESAGLGINSFRSDENVADGPHPLRFRESKQQTFRQRSVNI